MSNATYSGPGPNMLGQGSASTSDVVTKLDGIMRNLASSGQTLTSILSALQAALPTVTGSFTLTAAASTTVNQTLAQSNSFIQLTPTNAAAATLMGSAKSLYLSSINPGVSFTVATASSTAAGSETFHYAIFQPLG